jgi:hypothetical protein
MYTDGIMDPKAVLEEHCDNIGSKNPFPGWQHEMVLFDCLIPWCLGLSRNSLGKPESLQIFAQLPRLSLLTNVGEKKSFTFLS